jgi:glutathione synthase/RimK-type ligase-like ATP-grasp enzyme
MTVLIAGDAADPHIELVSQGIEELGGTTVLLDVRRIQRSGITYTWPLSSNSPGRLKTDESETSLDEIESVWFPLPVARAPSRGLDSFSRRVIESEWQAAFIDLFYLTNDRRWINPPDAGVGCLSKLHQLQVAKAVGFDIPTTLVTTDPETFAEFTREKPGGVASKRLSEFRWLLNPSTRNRWFPFTERLTSADLSDDVLARVPNCPCLLQEYIEKSTELRVYVTRSEVLACEILSQADRNTATDWRHYPLIRTKNGEAVVDPDRWKCRAVDLVPRLRQQCLDVVKRLGLEYSALDLIKTPGGEVVFLEANFGGAFAWIEKLTGLPVSRALARALTRSSDRARRSKPAESPTGSGAPGKI